MTYGGDVYGGTGGSTGVGSSHGFWDSFGAKGSFKIEGDGATGSLAAQVVAAYGLRCKTPNIGGNLTGLDIKHMDALQLIKVSLLQDSIGNSKGPYEAYVNYEDNSIEFKEVGRFSAGIGNDIYHQIQTGTYIEKCSGVMITGKNPMIERVDKAWDTLLKNVKYFDATDMVSNCNKKGFSSFVIVVYDDPHLDSKYNDGVDNFYDVTNPYESLIGYARRKYIPDLTAEATAVDARQCSVPIKVSVGDGVLGELAIPPAVTAEAGGQGSDCWAVLAAEAGGGVPIPMLSDLRYDVEYGDTVDKYMGVSKVYVIGTELRGVYGRPKTDAALAAGAGAGENEIWVSYDKNEERMFALKEGVEYVIAYEEGNPSIVFADQSHPDDTAKYGDNCTYNIYSDCSAARGLESTRGKTGNILPTGAASGILVTEVWAMVDLETPCTIIKDPHGNALDFAKSMEYDLQPLVMLDLPAPIAFAGRSRTEIIDQKSSQPDHDPTTSQDLRNTDFEDAISEMDAGGGITLNLSFLNEAGCLAMATMLYRYMNNLDGCDIVYVCGPNTNPQLGGYVSGGGVVNSITHEYTDSGSYTVSVTESGRLILDSDLIGISGGPLKKQVETFSAKGTIVEDMGNHVYFKVRIDGHGSFTAVNTTPSILRNGDKVTCTIHNSPMES
jgi:hypothetical protein